MANSTGSIGITKLQLALILGTPLVLGTAYYLYKSNKTSPEDEKKSSGKKEVTKNIEEKPKTPLDEAKAFKDAGNKCFKNGKYDEAIQNYDRAIEKCPAESKIDLAIFYQNRSAAYEQLKKWNNVIEDCSKSLECNNRYTKAYFRRAKAYEQTKDFMKCLEDITATCILEQFQNQNSIFYADRILKQTGADYALEGLASRTPVLPSPSFIRAYFKSFVMDPLHLNTPVAEGENCRGYLKAKVAFQKANYDDVIINCTEEIESSEAEAEFKSEALLLRSTFYLLSGRFIEAESDLDALINNDEVDQKIRCNALIKRAAVKVQTDEREKGMNDFKAAELLNPENADIYHQRAQIFILLDQLDDALKEFEKCVKFAPNHALAYVQKCYADYRLACVTQDQFRLFNVMTEFKSVMDKFPDCIDSYSLMAQVLAEQGQFAEADKYFEMAINKAPETASAYVHRGILQLQWTGDFQKAIEYMNKSIEIDEKCELAYETLGTIEVQRANLPRAIELFGKALKYAKSQQEMAHLHSLKNAAVAQMNVVEKLGVDMNAIQALSGMR